MKNVKHYRSVLIFLLMMGVFQLQAQKKIVGYIPTGYSTSSVDFSKITHLNIAFENPDDAGNLSYSGGNDAFVTEAHAKNVKVLISICGGGASNDVTTQNRYFNLLNASNRGAFISKIVAYLNSHNLDGIDLDLEGPAINGDYSAFVIALKSALPAGKLLTAALSHDNGGNAVSNAAIQTLDFLNIMAYDMGWGQAVHHSTYAYATTCMNWWVQNKGLAASKAILGVPFYGYVNTTGNGGITFSSIVNTYGAAAAQQDTWTSGGSTVYYNGIPTIRQKSQLVVDQNYGGIMIWQLAQDATGINSLLTNIKQVLGTTTCTLPTQPGTISGNTSVASGSSQTYSIGAVSGATSYTWSLPSSWSGSSSSTSITTTAGSTGGTISVSANNTCGSSTTRTLSVTIVGTPSSNLAINKTVTTSSVEPGTTFTGSNAVDGSIATRWSSSYVDPSWMYVDLGANYNVNRVKITWEGAFGTAYLIQVSTDAITWSTIKNVTGNATPVNDWTGLAGTARYVRMYGTARNSQWGYSIFEFEVYGTPITGNNFTTRIEAENFLNMFGIATEACSEGGLNIGYFDTSDWLTYNVTIPTAGTYKVSYRIATTATGRTLRLENAVPALLGEVSLPNTGGWQAWTTVSHNVSLPAGTYSLGITTYTGGLNLNWFDITNNLGARIASIETHHHISVYPNPVESQLNISEWIDFEGGEARVLDGTGRAHIITKIETGSIDVSTLSPGVYILRLRKNQNAFNTKFLKK